jgi:cell shape-determining protein MreC
MAYLILFVVLITILTSPQLQQQLFKTLVVLGLLILGLRFAFGLLPSWARQLVSTVTRAILNLVLGTGNKGKA